MGAALDGRIINSNSTEPHSNLALEESILRLNSQSDIVTLRFWRNNRSVIVGRWQVLDEEVNLSYCKEHGIKLGRRLTGGGTVFHDLGNLNTSLFFPRKSLLSNDIYKISSSFTNLIVQSIKEIGLTSVEREGCNTILYQGFKISGAASYFTKNMVLHHSTMLLNSELNHLEGSLIHHGIGRARKSSYYRPTTNLTGLKVVSWEKKFIELLESVFNLHFIDDEIRNDENELASRLRRKVYSQSSWIVKGERGGL
jgi:lipoate-protein ligase A